MRTLIGLIVTSLAAIAVGQVPSSGVPEQARQEVVRRGNMVVHTLQRSAGAAEFGETIGLPADDSSKWFVTLVTAKDSPWSDKLRADLSADQFLSCWVNPKEPAKSWAHYHEYSAQDATQAFRWKEIQLAGYPTLLVQPPLNGRYGDPRTVVLQVTGYTGDGHALSDALATTIRRYVQSVPPKAAQGTGGASGTQSGGVQRGMRAPGIQEIRGVGQQPIGVDPPFVIPSTPSNTPAVVLPLPVTPAPATPTPATPASPANLPADVWALLTTVLSGLTTSPWIHGSLLLAIFGLQLYRHLRVSTGQKVLLDDSTFAALIAGLKEIVAGPTSLTQAGPASTPQSPASPAKP